MATRILSAAVLALLLVTAGCLGTTVTAQTDGGTSDGANATRTIDVSATGTASADPDLAVVRLAVEARADSANAAREQVAADVERMREALRELGISDDAVRTTSFFVGPEYDYRERGRELVGYRAVHAFEVETDVDAPGEVIDAAVENGATQVHGVQFTLSEETQRELRDEALTAAVENARADADAIAAAAGVSVGPLHSAPSATCPSSGRWPRTPLAGTARARSSSPARWRSRRA